MSKSIDDISMSIMIYSTELIYGATFLLGALLIYVFWRRPSISVTIQTNVIQSNTSIESTSSTCANCGKGEEESHKLKTCTACKMVKYCNGSCQKAHRSQHKHECRKRAAELHDEVLFKHPPLHDDCSICMLTLPPNAHQSSFKSCCGKTICNGCICEIMMRGGGKRVKCAFCRMPRAETQEEEHERMRKLFDSGNADAFNSFGEYYANGEMGLPQDMAKANELFMKAGELGCASSYHKLGMNYEFGRGVERDKKKAKYYIELAAIGGDASARHNLGALEGQAGKYRRAIKHLLIAAKAGKEESLDAVKKGFMNGKVTKDEYASALRVYQKRHDEIKSDARDKAAAFEEMRVRKAVLAYQP